MNAHQITENWDQSFPLSQSGRVTVDQGAGRVEVRGWTKDEVRVQAVRHGRAIVQAHGRGGRVHVEARSEAGLFFAGRGRADLTVWVPNGAYVEIDSASGDVEVHGVRGTVKIDSSGGNIIARNVGPLEASSASGSISVNGAAGPVRLDAGSGLTNVSAVSGEVIIDSASGGVFVDSVRGSVKVDSSSSGVELRDLRGPEVVVDAASGPVKLRQIDCRRIDVDNGSGSIEAEFAVCDGGSYEFETRSGKIDLAIPVYSRCSIVTEASTSSSISCDLPLTNKSIDSETLSGVLNEGRSRVTARTGSGRIKIGRARFEVATPATPLVGERDASIPAREPLSDEYIKVLKMVEEGKLTPDEADALLEAMESPSGETG